jgi:WD40 repeat protein
MRLRWSRFSLMSLMLTIAVAAILLALARAMYQAGVNRSPTAQVTSLGFSPSGSLLAAGYEDGTVRVWDVASARERRMLIAHTDRIVATDFAPDTRTLVTCAADGEVKLWSIERAEEIGSFLATTAVKGVHFAADGETLAVVSEASQVELLGGQDLRHRFTTDAHYAGLSRDGGRLATCVWQSPRFQTAVFDAQGHSLPETDRGQFVWFPPALPSGQWSIDAGGGWLSASRVYLHSLVDPRDRCFLGWHEWRGEYSVISGLAIAPNGRTSATGGEDGTVMIWDLEPALRASKFRDDQKYGRTLAILETLTGRVTALAFSSDSLLLAAGGFGYIEIWDASSQTQVRLVPGPQAIPWMRFAVALGVWLAVWMVVWVRSCLRDRRQRGGTAQGTATPRSSAASVYLPWLRRIAGPTSVLLALALLAAFLGRYWKASEQYAAATALAKRGALVWYDYQSTPTGNSAYVQPSEPGLLLRWLGRDFFHRVTAVECSSKRVIGFRDRPGFVRDEDLASLEHLSGLRELDLHEMPVTDAGLSRARNLRNLERLDLAETDITDVGLPYLRALSHLNYLNVKHTKVTEAAVERLRQALPNASIEFSTDQNNRWEQFRKQQQQRERQRSSR